MSNVSKQNLEEFGQELATHSAVDMIYDNAVEYLDISQFDIESSIHKAVGLLEAQKRIKRHPKDPMLVRILPGHSMGGDFIPGTSLDDMLEHHMDWVGKRLAKQAAIATIRRECSSHTYYKLDTGFKDGDNVQLHRAVSYLRYLGLILDIKGYDSVIEVLEESPKKEAAQ